MSQLPEDGAEAPKYVVCPKRSCSGLAYECNVNWWPTPPALFTQQDPVDVQ
jgi:hypothetical protein